MTYTFCKNWKVKVNCESYHDLTVYQRKWWKLMQILNYILLSLHRELNIAGVSLFSAPSTEQLPSAISALSTEQLPCAISAPSMEQLSCVISNKLIAAVESKNNFPWVMFLRWEIWGIHIHYEPTSKSVMREISRENISSKKMEMCFPSWRHVHIYMYMIWQLQSVVFTFPLCSFEILNRKNELKKLYCFHFWDHWWNECVLYFEV